MVARGLGLSGWGAQRERHSALIAPVPAPGPIPVLCTELHIGGEGRGRSTGKHPEPRPQVPWLSAWHIPAGTCGVPQACAGLGTGRRGQGTNSPPLFWGLGWLGWHHRHHRAGETEAWEATGLAAGDGVAGAGRAWGRAATCPVIPTLGIAFPWLLLRVDAIGACGAGDAGGSLWPGLAHMGLLGCALSCDGC